MDRGIELSEHPSHPEGSDKNTSVIVEEKDSETGIEGTFANKDEAILARFGKKQQLRRTFGLFPVISLTCSMTITWEVITATLTNGLENGGPAGLVYGYIGVWIAAGFQALVMAEMASMIPLAGGPFNWVAILSPPSCKNFLSYLAGWLTVISWQAFVAGTTYVTGTLIQGLLIMNYPDYIYKNWHATLMIYAVLAFALFLNTYLGRLLPQIESMMLFFHILGFFAVIITIVYLAPHQPAKEVFTTFLNDGGWSSNGLAFFVGLVTVMDAFPGLDAADHMAEEIKDAPRTIPLSMGASVIINGSLGFAMLLALLFCMPDDITAVLEDPTMYPFMAIYTYAVGSVKGSTAMACVIVITQIFATVGVVATASRMLWAFAREGGVPGSKYIAKVDERTMLPLYAIGTTAIITMLLSLINIGSSVGFGALISLCVASYYLSFILAACVMLYRRLTTPESEIPWGPFKLGKFGVPVTVVAIAYSVFGTFFSLWPTTVNPTLESMNYCVLVLGAVLIIAGLFWIAYGRKTYKGPVIELPSGSSSW